MVYDNTSASKNHQVSGNNVEKVLLKHDCFTLWEMAELERCAPERVVYQKNAREAAVGRIRWEGV